MTSKCDVCGDIYERAEGVDARKHGILCGREVFVVETLGAGLRVGRSSPFDTFEEAATCAKQWRYPEAVVRRLIVHPDGFLVDPSAVSR